MMAKVTKLIEIQDKEHKKKSTSAKTRANKLKKIVIEEKFKNGTNSSTLRYTLRNQHKLTESQEIYVRKGFKNAPQQQEMTNFLLGASKTYKATVNQDLIERLEKNKVVVAKKNGYIVEAPTRIKGIDRKNDQKRENARTFLSTKWNNLQYIRNEIITQLSLVKKSAEQVKQMEIEAEKIKELYFKTRHQVNIAVTNQLIENENLDLEAARLFSVYTTQRKQELLKLEAISTKDAKDLIRYQERLQALEYDLEEIEAENQNILDFKNESVNSPESLTLKISELEKQRNIKVEQYEKIINIIKERMDLEAAEIRRIAMDKIGELGKEVGTRFSKLKQHSLSGLYYKKNCTVKREIVVHLQNHVKLDSEIGDLERVERELRTVMEKIGKKEGLGKGKNDVRRRVLNLKKYMDCDPEMDIQLAN